jgi:UTP--glucose-1-phosphate uridylyltransferase
MGAMVARHVAGVSGQNASRMSAEGLHAAEEKMRNAGEPRDAIRAFRRAYERVDGGETAIIRSADLEPAVDVPTLDALPDAGGDALSAVAAIRLNGGLATTMGLRHPKSLVIARDGRTFLDIIVSQTLVLRERYGVRLPLLLMNSEATRRDTLEALTSYPELDAGLPLEFMQSMEPKLDSNTLAPVVWPPAPELEWCPPGHGDVYGALRRSGALSTLLENGFRYAMICNSDNLGARVEPRIASFMASEQIPFLMEVIEGTEAERKGGHLARRRSDGHLVLRETAQTDPDDEASFRDYKRWHYYNTNSLWIDLEALERTLASSHGVLELPLIINRKTVDPRDKTTTPVIQLESAMGAAVQNFPGAQLLCVPRTRFVPVKTTNDLLLMRSDVYRLTDDVLVQPIPERVGRLPYIDLDKRFYGVLEEFDKRFPSGPPSLREAERVVVAGDITFGAGVVVRGAAQLEADEPTFVPDGSVLGV